MPGTRPEDPRRDTRGGKTTFTRQNDAACDAELRKGFTTLAGVALLNTIQGARTTRKVLQTPDSDSGGTTIDRDGMAAMMAQTDATIDNTTR